jgi:hypothetical protein
MKVVSIRALILGATGAYLAGLVMASALWLHALGRIEHLVEPLPPVVEHRGQDYEVVQLRFGLRNRVWVCHATLYRDRSTWSVTC